MAITKTTTINSITIYYGQEDPSIEINSSVNWDDPDDDLMPVSKSQHKRLYKVTRTTTYDETTGNPTTTEAATDYSGEDQRVQDICAAVWAS
jgi:hypothetical protein